MTTSSRTVNSGFGAYLERQVTTEIPVHVELSYRADDPYAVRLRLPGPIEWRFARDLLARGATEQVGEGDVTAWRWKCAGQTTLALRLAGESGEVVLQLPMHRVKAFLRRTYASVPPGAETEWIDVDADLALLTWGRDGQT